MNRPNILLVLTDQQTLRASGACGGPAHTPHMDSIAARGVRFERSYCTSPVCGPARASLATGRLPHEVGANVNGQALAPGSRTFGQALAEAGYHTAWAGKWHVPVAYPGFHDPQTPQGQIPGFEVLPLDAPERSGLGARTDPIATDAAVEFLRRPHDRPFCLTLSLHNPHDICHWVSTSPHPVEVREDDLPPLPANFEPLTEEPEFIRQCRQRDHYGPENLKTATWDPIQWRLYLDAYYRFVEQVDVQVGRVLQTLCEQGLEEQTLVVFTSDHGEGCAAHRWVVKLMLWETTTAVPLIVAWPGRTPAGVADRKHLVSGMDVPPTLWDYAGIDAPPVTGQSLRPWIENPGRPGRESLMVELAPDTEDHSIKGRMLRTGDLKYVAFNRGARPEMLFDLADDPGETADLTEDPTRSDDLHRCRALLADWMTRTDDTWE